jgi:signal transduction histidine kinase
MTSGSPEVPFDSAPAAPFLENNALAAANRTAPPIAANRRTYCEMATARGVILRISSGLPALVIDPALVELVLLNLVSNAIKYSDPSKQICFVEIGRAAADEEQERACIIYVRDNGLGIPEDQRDAIFDRFFRAHAHLDGELGVSGTGLGLAIVAECIQALGGTIRCESAVAEGTTFLIGLPCEHDLQTDSTSTAATS